MLVASLALVLFLGLLAIPVTLIFRIDPKDMRHPTFTWVWLYGVVRIENRENRSRRNKRNPKKKHKKRQSNSVSLVFGLIRQSAFRKRIMKFLSHFIAAIERNDLHLQIKLGLDDPADTGVLWGVIGPIAGWIETIKNLNVDLVPEFNENVFEIDGHGNVRFIPLHLMYLVAALLFAPAIWATLMRAAREK